MTTQTLEAIVTLPGGEQIDVSHFKEYDGYSQPSFGESFLIGTGYLQAKRREPLFVTTIELYFEEKLGPEWANIIKMEDQLHQQMMERGRSGVSYMNTAIDIMAYWARIGSNYQLAFVGKEDNYYIFQLTSLVLHNEPTFINHKVKVMPTISVENYYTTQ